MNEQIDMAKSKVTSHYNISFIISFCFHSEETKPLSERIMVNPSMFICQYLSLCK